MKLFGGFLEVLLMANAITAKKVSDVFTSFKSIVKSTDYESNTQYPFDWYKVEIGWSIDTEAVITGDTFTLKMPYVYEVRILREGELRNYFDITSNGKSIASCDVDPAGGRSLETTITCKVTADLSQYSTLSGTVDFVVVLDNGGRKETIDSANHWKIGTNTVTFNDKLSSQVSFRGVDSTANQFLSRITMRGDTFYYYAAPCDMCQGRAISSGSFVFDILDDGYELKEADTEAYVTNSLNSFGFPGAVQDLEISSRTLQNSNQRVSINFGSIDSGSRFWFSTFSDKIDTIYRDYTVKSTLSVSCSGGGFDFDSHTTTLSPVRGCAVGVGSGNSRPVTTITTETWAQCTESTKFVTGSGSTVTEIVEVPNTSLCAASTLTTSYSSKTSKKTTSCSTNSTSQVPTLRMSKSCSSISHGSHPKATSCSTDSVPSKTSVSPAGSSSTRGSSCSDSTCLSSSSCGSVYSFETSSYSEKPSSPIESTSLSRTAFSTESNFSTELSSVTEVSSSSEGSSTISDASHNRSSSSIEPSFSTKSTSSTQSNLYSDLRSYSEVSSFSEHTSSDIKFSSGKSSCSEVSSSTESSSSVESSFTKATSSIESSSIVILSIELSGLSGPSCLTSSTKTSSIMTSCSVATSSTPSIVTSSSESSSTTTLTGSSQYQFSSGYWNSSITEPRHSRTSSVLTQSTSDTVTSLTVTSSSSTVTSSSIVTIISSLFTGSSFLSSSSMVSTSKISTTYVLPYSFVTTTIFNSHSISATGQTASSTAPPENGQSYSAGSSLESSTVLLINNSDVPEGNTVSSTNVEYVSVTAISQKNSTVTPMPTVTPFSTIHTTPKEQLRSSDTDVGHGNEITTSTPATTNDATSYSGSAAQSSSNTGTLPESSSTIYVTSSSSSSPAVTILEGLGSMTHLSGLLTLVAVFINAIFI